MPFSSGTFTLVAGNPVVTGTVISSTWANNTLNDIANNGLSNCMLKDGTQTPTAAITMGGFRLTNLGNATAVTDAARVSQVQNSSYNTLSSVSGVTTITGNAVPTPAAYAEGQVFGFIAVGANGPSPTLNVSGLGGLPLFWHGATATSSMWSTGDSIRTVYLSTSSQTGHHIIGHSGFMPVNFLRTRGSIPVGEGNGNATPFAPSADDQILVSTASASVGQAFKAFDHFAANQSQMEAGTSTANYVSPLNAQFHPSAAKAWGYVTAPNTINTSFSQTTASCTNSTLGVFTVSFGRTMGSANYAISIVSANATANAVFPNISSLTTTSFQVAFTTDGGGAGNPTFFSYMIFGDAA